MSVPIAPSITTIRSRSRSSKRARREARVNGVAPVAPAAAVAVGSVAVVVVRRSSCGLVTSVRSVALDATRRQPRAVLRGVQPAELEQPDDPRPLAPPRLEQLEHPRVVSARLAG